MSKPHNGQSPELTALRGWAILAVVGLHVASNYREAANPGLMAQILAFFCMVARLGVPLFLFISGRLLAMRYAWPFPVGNFYRRRLNVVFLPYLVFSLIYLGLYAAQKGSLDWIDWGRRLMSATAAEHLWFFRLIFQIYLLYPLLAWWRSRSPNARFGLAAWIIVWLAQVAVGLRAALCIPEGPARMVGEFLTFAEFGLYFFSGMTSAPGSGGMWDRLWNNGLKKGQTAALTSSVLLLAAAQGWFLFSQTDANGWWDLKAPSYRLASALLEPFLFLGLIRLGFIWNSPLRCRTTGLSGWIQQLGQDSYGIYLVHLLFLAAGVRAARLLSLDAAEILFYPLVLVWTLILSMFFVRSVRRISAMRWLIGE